MYNYIVKDKLLKFLKVFISFNILEREDNILIFIGKYI